MGILSYTKKGYRLIALAYKELDSSFSIVKIEKTSREKFESELNFLGMRYFYFIETWILSDTMSGRCLMDWMKEMLSNIL